MIELTLPKYPDSSHAFHHDLLTEALKESGRQLKINALGPMPQPRPNAEFDKREISALWLVENKERNGKYTPVKVGIANGLIGNRILFIP